MGIEDLGEQWAVWKNPFVVNLHLSTPWDFDFGSEATISWLSPLESG